MVEHKESEIYENRNHHHYYSEIQSYKYSKHEVQEQLDAINRKYKRIANEREENKRDEIEVLERKCRRDLSDSEEQEQSELRDVVRKYRRDETLS